MNERCAGKILLVFGIVLGISGAVRAQTTIKGRVADKVTREPLEAAVITDAATGRNTVTDKNGRFTLKKAAPGDSLIVSFIGYTSVTIRSKSRGQDLAIELEKGAVDLKTVVITRQSNNLTSSRVLSSIDLNMQPVKSAQDLLRLVPGLFIAQHQGGGKAEQIFLRGFDADHGTDVNVSVDGMPVNMVSHAHGQGYADLHFLIPETVSGYDFGKGPYYTDKGDFTTAGYVAYHTYDVLDRSMVKIEGGQYNTLRGIVMLDLLSAGARQKGQSAYITGEGLYSDGPFHLQEHFNRGNLFGKFVTPLGADNKLIVEASTLSSIWRASGEIPNRAVAEGYMKDRFDAIDSFQGGNTTRTNAILRLSSKLGDRFTWDNEAFYTHYFFNLISNFTFYYFYPTTGDEFGQHEKRNMVGYTSRLSRQDYLGGATLTSAVGVGIRYDRINPSWLSHTLHGDTILNYIQLGNTRETNLNGYLDETLATGPWLFNAGVRVDYLHFDYDNQAPLSDSTADIFIGVSPRAAKSIISPKINIQYTASPEVQLYVKAGKGFHSNDVRIVIANQGYQILPAAYGADLGINWKPLPRLFINTALWYLFLQQEFTYGADLGDVSVSPGGRTQREGIDFSARYQITDWLFANLNIDLARPRDLDSAKGRSYLPLAPTFTSTGGLDFRFKNGINGGISYRYLHNRAANSDYSLTALGYFLGDLTVNYTTKKYEIGLAIENLFNQEWNESQFEYISRLQYETQPVDQVSYTPGVPFFAKLKFSVFF
jgi:CarboxypepD_reg-like domain/TonB-dependent Receptor Plug Domain